MTAEDTTQLSAPNRPGWFHRVPMDSLMIVVGTITTIGWVAIGGTPALVISIIAGSLIALRGSVRRS